MQWADELRRWLGIERKEAVAEKVEPTESVKIAPTVKQWPKQNLKLSESVRRGFKRRPGDTCHFRGIGV